MDRSQQRRGGDDAMKQAAQQTTQELADAGPRKNLRSTKIMQQFKFTNGAGPGQRFAALPAWNAPFPYLAAACCLAAILGNPASTQAQQQREFLGVASCASTVCHGSVMGREGGNIPQNEYLIWSEKDAHRRAFATLTTDRSKQIASKLGIADATQADLCLDCHATNAPEEIRGEKFQINDGVQCESCHGASGDWIATHDDEDISYATSVANGLTPIADPGARATVCLSCHIGDADRFVSHRIMAAGHPRTSFELDTFTFLQPFHFVSDADYAERKQAYDSAKSWASGQASAVDRQLDVLARPARSGGWPEFAQYDCFDCHHSFGSRKSGGEASGAVANLGYPGINQSHWLMYTTLLDAIAPDRVSEIRSTLRALDAAAHRGEDLKALAASLKSKVANSNTVIAQWNPEATDLRTVAAAISSQGTARQLATYTDAEQVTMALQALVAGLQDRRALDSQQSAILTEELDLLFDDLAQEDGFRIERFRATLEGFAKALRS